ncbi:GAF domain-containing protein [Amnibacterium kyonggiense]|uniref:GAF domain-containing protein n=1 Tax=Amnibacterium kyonggiense TaxID=595671 RepID=A0A4R7FR52_9MICO|nr:GAF domain-containing protein [Amnibacterium kyonggiense]TDS80253.1 GAF domain-containing protein [Amnibacterium kyonggiense]
MNGTRPPTPGRRLASARLHRSGRDPQRVLLVTESVLLGASTAAPFAELLADRVATRTGRGLDLDIAWDLGPVLRAVTHSTEAWRLWRYEAVVVLARTSGEEDAGGWRRERIRRIADQVLPELARASSVLIVRIGAPSPRDHRWDGPTVSSLRVPDDEDGAGRGGADAVADRLVGLLGAADREAGAGTGGTARERRDLPQPEAERQQAVDRVTDALGGLTPHLERVVLLARNTFGVPFAQVNLLDHGRIRTLAYVGAAGDDAEQPICTITVRGSGPTIIADTWEDHRLDANPHVHAAAHPVRFYAAHPIESLDGYRIGTLCVFDLVPHDPADVDPAVLRDLAQLAEAEISTLPD